MIFNYSFSYKHNLKNIDNQPIAVIANFASDGRFIPIYFRYIFSDSSEATIKIDAISYIKEKHESYSFLCLVTTNYVQQQILLTFHVNNCIWFIENC